MADPRKDPQFQKIQEMRRQAVLYYKENGVPELMETALNKMFFEKPQDVYMFLVEFFQNHSKPSTIDKVEAGEYFDSKGQPTLSCEIFTESNGKFKRLSGAFVSSFNQLSDAAPSEKRDHDDEERSRGVKAAIKYIEGPIGDAIKGCLVSEQSAVDDILRSTLAVLQDEEAEKERQAVLEAAAAAEAAAAEAPATPATSDTGAKGKPGKAAKEKGGKADKNAPKEIPKTPEISEAPKDLIFSGAQAVCAVSSATAIAGAVVRSMPPFQYIAELTHGEAQEGYRIPIPMVTLLSGGRSVAGKQNVIKELLLIPKPSLSTTVAISKAKDLSYRLTIDLSKKMGITTKMMSDQGAPAPAVDKWEQLLDATLEAAAALNIQIGEDYFLGVHCAAHDFWDSNKEKYEAISGVYKSADEMVDTIYVDLVNKYPSIMAFIDPLVPQDVAGWNKLYNALRDRCYVLGERSLGRVDQVIREGAAAEFPHSGHVVQFNHSATVSDVVQLANLCREREQKLVVSASPGDTTDTLLVDLAVGVGAHFIKIGGFCRGERAAKYNRLLELYKMVDNGGNCLQSDQDVFTFNPEVPADETDANADQTEGTLAEADATS